MLPPLILFMMYAGVAMALGMLVHLIRSFVLEMRAARELVRLLATRDEYRPLLRALLPRAQQHGGRVDLSEHEAVDLREHLRRALVHLPPADRRRIEQGLYAPLVEDREVYLRNVLSASVWRLQHQA
jgi:hypothetical protein